MNMVLFEASEIGKPIARNDARIKHVLEVLGCKTGDDFDAGEVNGPSGKAVISKIGSDSVELKIEWLRVEPPLPPIDLIVGLSRPQTNRKILQEATSLGVRSISFVRTERGEPSYATSKLWTTGEWRRYLIAGAAQAFSTRLPEVAFDLELSKAITLVSESTRKIALDNYEADVHLGAVEITEQPVALAIGSERGWTHAERDLLRSHHFEMTHLGIRPLRTETATIAGLAILLRRFC